MPLTRSHLAHLDLDVYLSAILDLRIQQTRDLLKVAEHEETESQKLELEQMKDGLATEGDAVPTESPLQDRSERLDDFTNQSRSRQSNVDHDSPIPSPSRLPPFVSPPRSNSPETSHETPRTSNKNKVKALQRQKRNARNRLMPSNMAKTKRHAIDKGKINIEKLELEIGSRGIKLEESGLSSENGWQGSTMRQRLKRDGVAPESLPRAISFDSSRSSTLAYSADGHLCFVRAGNPPEGFLDDFQDLARSILADEQLHSASVKFNTRSTDIGQLIIGTDRPYSQDLKRTGPYKEHATFVYRILRDPRFVRLVNYVNQLFETYYPKVYARYKDADPGGDSPFHSLFGAFPLFCMNWSRSGKGCSSQLHVDAKNPAGGICCVVAYGRYNSKKKFWLRLKELNVIIELPPGVPIFFPSALFAHGNVDGPDVFEAESEDEVRAGHGTPRGSFVFYGQSSWIQLAELGMTVFEARNRGISVQYRDLATIFKTEF